MAGAVGFDLQDDIVTLGELLLDGTAGGAVVVAVVDVIFQHAVIGDELLKFCPGNEVVMHAVHFAGAGARVVAETESTAGGSSSK